MGRVGGAKRAFSSSSRRVSEPSGVSERRVSEPLGVGGATGSRQPSGSASLGGLTPGNGRGGAGAPSISGGVTGGESVRVARCLLAEFGASKSDSA